METGKIYRCELLSIKPNIRVNKDESMRKNIANAEVEPVGEILVRPSGWSDAYVFEILTNRKIPVHTTYTYHTCDMRNGDVEVTVPKSPCFVKVAKVVKDDTTELVDGASKVTPEEVYEYMAEHPNRDDYALALFEIFNRGRMFYDNASKIGVYSDDKQIKMLLNTLRHRKH